MSTPHHDIIEHVEDGGAAHGHLARHSAHCVCRRETIGTVGGICGDIYSGQDRVHEGVQGPVASRQADPVDRKIRMLNHIRRQYFPPADDLLAVLRLEDGAVQLCRHGLPPQLSTGRRCVHCHRDGELVLVPREGAEAHGREEGAGDIDHVRRCLSLKVGPEVLAGCGDVDGAGVGKQQLRLPHVLASALLDVLPVSPAACPYVFVAPVHDDANHGLKLKHDLVDSAHRLDVEVQLNFGDIFAHLLPHVDRYPGF
mmetsp:Transcript_46748/g.74785  ORF Transcript_46748/g.74785 Transcript_46748/m.74785 type:complete len:255 (-) Transcript_46748:572-1336(-)